jgi:hypothetical protein
MEALAINCVTIPMQRRLLGGLGAHARGVPILVTDSAMRRELIGRLVVTIFGTLETLDTFFLHGRSRLRGLE